MESCHLNGYRTLFSIQYQFFFFHPNCKTVDYSGYHRLSDHAMELISTIVIVYSVGELFMTCVQLVESKSMTWASILYFALILMIIIKYVILICTMNNLCMYTSYTAVSIVRAATIPPGITLQLARCYSTLLCDSFAEIGFTTNVECCLSEPQGLAYNVPGTEECVPCVCK